MIDVLKLLDDLGIPYYPAGPNNVKIKCINPGHNETRPSMHIHKFTGIFNCLGCHFSGNIFSLLKNQLQTESHMEVMKFLMNYAQGGLTEDEVFKSLEKTVTSRNKTFKKEEIGIHHLPHRLIENHPYLSQRGITPAEIKEWQMGVVTDKKYNGWIYIPIYQNDILRNYFLRSPFGDGKKYDAVPRNDLVFGIDKALDKTKKVYLVEGIFDMIFVRKTRQQCVAILSNRILRLQFNLLKDYKEIVIVPDNDEQGFWLIKSALPFIHKCSVKVCKLPEHRKDAGETTIEEMLKSMLNEVSIQDFYLKTMREYRKNQNFT